MRSWEIHSIEHWIGVNLILPDSSVDAWVSDQGVAKYGNSDAVAAELTRVSKPGAIFRASQERRLMIGQKTFAQRLTALGWEVYAVVRVGKDGSSHFTDIVCAKLTNKPEPSEV